MSSASDVLKLILLVSTSMLLQNAAKRMGSLGHRRSDLWAADLGIYCSNVYGKISFAPLKFWPVDNDTTYFMSNRSVAAYL